MKRRNFTILEAVLDMHQLLNQVTCASLGHKEDSIRCRRQVLGNENYLNQKIHKPYFVFSTTSLFLGRVGFSTYFAGCNTPIKRNRYVRTKTGEATGSRK